MMGKPRRCSPTFFSEERSLMEFRRNKVRKLQQQVHQGVVSSGYVGVGEWRREGEWKREGRVEGVGGVVSGGGRVSGERGAREVSGGGRVSGERGAREVSGGGREEWGTRS